MDNSDNAIVQQAQQTGDAVSHGAMATGGVIFPLLLLAVMYLLPTIIALFRKHRQVGPIAALNILLGWSVLGWIGAFIWCLMTPQAPQTVIVNTGGPATPTS